MAGFTAIYLKDCSQKNIDEQNKKLAAYKVAKQYRFYSLENVRKEYEYFLKGDGYFPEDQFPRNKIKSFEDFRKYWSTESLGEVFVPKFGSLTFDCYFGRTSKRAMHNIANYLIDNISLIKGTNGLFSTFVERCGKYKYVKKELLTLDN